MTRIPYTPRGYQGMITDQQLDMDRTAIWSFMGSGKTVATLTALDMQFLTGESQPALVVAPKRVARSTWPNEVAKWDHLRHISIMPIIGLEQERRDALKFDASVYTVNFDNVPWLVDHFGERWPFKTVIWDESTRLSGFRLKQGKAQARAIGRIAHTKIKRFVELTGTPAPNGLSKLWGQIWMLDAGQRLGRTYDAFRQRWFQQSFDGYGIAPLPFAQEQIQDKLRDICLTIDAKDWFDLAAPIVNNVYVDLPVKARAKYREMEKTMFTEIEGRTVEAFGAAARTQKCLQLANGAVYVDPDADSDAHPRAKEWREVHDVKLQALDSIVEEINGEPVLVSYQFKSDMARIMRQFPKARLLDDDPQTENEWNAGKISMLLAHPKSAGHGLNLQDGGRHIAFFGHDWDLELYQQINERIGPVRQMQSGHNRSVHVHHIIARDTVDEMVMARRETKREVQDILLDAMKRRK